MRQYLRLGLVLLLAACATKVPGEGKPAQAPTPPVAATPAAPPADGRARVALLLPLTGTSSPIGTALLNAAQMALFDHGDERFVLLPYDTQGTPTGAREAARKAVQEGKAQLVLGPLFAAEAGAARGETQAARVSMLAFTNDTAQAGGNTWVMGFAPGDQVARVVGYSRAQGKGNIAALVPRSPYGQAVGDALNRAAPRVSARVTTVERYDPQAPDFGAAARQLAGRKGFDALLLAEGGDRLRTLVASLTANGIDPHTIRLLGTGLWDDPVLGRDPALVGGWYAAPPASARGSFESRFTSLYGRPPPRIATLAYDATAMAAVLARSGNFDVASLTATDGFAGIDGIFRLKPDGTVERGLAVQELAADGARTVDPAPGNFQALTQ